MLVEKVVAAQRPGYIQAALKFAQKEGFVAVQAALLERAKLRSHWATSVPAWHEAVERAAGLAEDAAPAIGEPHLWLSNGKDTSLYKEAKAYHDPKGMKRRREAAVLARGAQRRKKGVEAKFRKHDFANLVISEGLRTKREAIEYMKENGDEAMHADLHQMLAVLQCNADVCDAERVAEEGRFVRTFGVAADGVTLQLAAVGGCVVGACKRLTVEQEKKFRRARSSSSLLGR